MRHPKKDKAVMIIQISAIESGKDSVSQVKVYGLGNDGKLYLFEKDGWYLLEI